MKKKTIVSFHPTGIFKPGDVPLKIIRLQNQTSEVSSCLDQPHIFNHDSKLQRGLEYTIVGWFNFQMLGSSRNTSHLETIQKQTKKVLTTIQWRNGNFKKTNQKINIIKKKTKTKKILLSVIYQQLALICVHLFSLHKIAYLHISCQYQVTRILFLKKRHIKCDIYLYLYICIFLKLLCLTIVW